MVGKTVLITGIAVAPAYFAALDFARKGDHVFVVDDDVARGGRAREDLCHAAGHDGIHFIHADLANLDEGPRLAERIAVQAGGLDVLVNGAMLVPRGESRPTAERVPPAPIGAYMGPATVSNFLSSFALTECLRPMLERADHAAIVNFVPGDFAMVRHDPFVLDGPESGATTTNDEARAPLLALLWTFALARRLFPLEVRVNAVEPSAWEMALPLASEATPEITGRFFDSRKRSHPTMRTLDAEDQERAWDLAVRLLPPSSQKLLV